ncbi:MAG TPA: hypothetical protein VLU47_18150, partial [Blastocatellia bacterium]|nr:hypothetical protein [Blastocatellia bacterium]
MPAELAELLVREQDNHDWLHDELDLDAKHEPRFTDEDVAEARNARKVLGADLAYIDSVIPSMADLPDSVTIAGLHQDLVGAANLEQRIAGERLPAISMTAREPAARAEILLTIIEEVIEFFDATTDKRWLIRIFDLWRRDGLDSGSTRLFNELIPVMSAIADRRPDMLRNAVRAPPEAVGHLKVLEAVERAIRGKRPFSTVSFGKKEARDLVQQIEVQGRRPDSTEDWQKVCAYLTWRGEILGFSGKWIAISEEFDLPPLEDQGDRAGKWIADALSLLQKASRILQEHGPRMSLEVKELFPHGVDARTVAESKARAAALAEVIKLNLSKVRLAGSRAIRTDLINRVAVCSGAVIEQMKNFVENDLGNPDLNAQQTGDRWEAHCRELSRVHNLKRQLAEVGRVANLIQESGGVKWAQQLRTQPALNADDPLTPGAWRESWQWARISGYLRRIDGRDRIRELSRMRLEFEEDCRKTFGEVVKVGTYIGLKQNLTDYVLSALQRFTRALQRIPAGRHAKTGSLYRGFARTAMEQCYGAVPCWVMPTWRVSETLPAELGSFDVVIVDEASQSDIAALPALMRGNKLLIVGDD